MKLPWVPPGRTAQLPGRGEIFYRHHERPDAPATLLLLHGWTASADLQFFTAYEELAEQYSFVAVDHRGHGRGIRAPFTLEDAADDAAALVRQLGVRSACCSPIATRTSSPGSSSRPPRWSGRPPAGIGRSGRASA
jgi:pimeloyl-ACP methyl ester carboxylesterase